jgi:hypothetical protein
VIKLILPEGLSIRVPAACWKAILRTDPDTCAIAFMMPNEAKVEGNIEDYAMSVDELESLIQIDLFPQLPDSVEKRIESALASDAWEMSSGGGFNRSGLQCFGPYEIGEISPVRSVSRGLEGVADFAEKFAVVNADTKRSPDHFGRFAID